jgi:RNA polymerase sigma-70 factor (ECF subfamily)
MASDSQSGRLAYSKWLLALTREENKTLEERLAGLFDELRVPIFRYVLVMLRNAAEAEDVTQECFLRLFVDLRSGKRIDNMKAWLFRAGHNLAIDRRRLHDFRLQDSLDGDAQDLVDGRYPSSEEAMLRQEQLAMMRAALDRLSPQQRLCLHLRTEGFRYREIADILGVSESTVCENLRRGLSRLMKDCHEG